MTLFSPGPSASARDSAIIARMQGKKKRPASASTSEAPRRRAGDSRSDLIAVIVAHAQSLIDSDQVQMSSATSIADALGAYYQHASTEELQERDPQQLAGAALAHLAYARERTPGHASVRVYSPEQGANGWGTAHTVIETVNDDMPFLVDSLGVIVGRLGLRVELTIHPVLLVKRDNKGRMGQVRANVASEQPSKGWYRESLVQMQISRETDAEVLKRLVEEIHQSIGDTRAAVTDWRAMREIMSEAADELADGSCPVSRRLVSESVELLRWMGTHNFTFIGYREYRVNELDDAVGPQANSPNADLSSGLGVLRDRPPPELVTAESARAVNRQLQSRDPLTITKANLLSNVHRPGRYDYVGVKRYNEHGEVIGERRFLGHFTSIAYSGNPRQLPYLGYKIEQVIERSGLDPISHAGKSLLHILVNHPRDELFQASVEDLTRIAEGIRSLQERQRTRMFLRRDAFRRFISCIIYVPRDRFNTTIRTRIEQILMQRLEGLSVETQVQLTDSRLARIYTIVRTEPDVVVKVRIEDVQRRIEDAVRSWEDSVLDSLQERLGEQTSHQLHSRFAHYFRAAYREDVTPAAAAYDIERMAALGDGDECIEMNLYRPPHEQSERLRFKLVKRGSTVPISDALPMLEHMGLRVLSERPYRVPLPADRTMWIQDFEMLPDGVAVPEPDEVTDIFEACFERVWRGEAEDDGFNRLVLGARLSWRETALIRAYSRYLLQTDQPFSQDYMEQVLGRHPKIARMLVEQFALRFDPARTSRKATRQNGEMAQALDAVASADEDRILRAFLGAINATLRTNFYQHDSDGQPLAYISFKLDPQRIADLPEPRPMFEIFVYSPAMEGVHLRTDKIARGGLRWSDRRADFRTEVLGLMKAQKVKNTLIVPMGAKGGFVCKRLPDGDRAAVGKEVVRCYKSFIRGLLDITDNILDGDLRPPQNVVCLDPPDPYLVVAADKGTATFSDTANEVAAEYDFWLGDAFASGGSAGYDHKGMGITARGGWEAVKRHFRETGLDIQSEPFTVTGIGDMGGDVFGNAMLLSPHIRLQAAFNHLHIFIDPDPDIASTFAERKRLFEGPRSGWDAYDTRLISTGGGVFARADKHIPLSTQMRKMLGVEADKLTPTELIRAILMMPVDLLWNGGIGTYVKAAGESHAEVGDRANDLLRVDGQALRCKVLGEGGNLGLTQRGRIEYALAGGRLNTDFIDNSAGVDCSDREVNIKILLAALSEAGDLARVQRNSLLAKMTDEVGQLVLRNNYVQTQAISITETHAAERLAEHQHIIRILERSGELDRQLEFLPDAEQLAERQKAGKGLVRPELAILLAYSKISLYRALVDTDIAEDAYFADELKRYFPRPLARKAEHYIPSHRLASEIIATQVTNTLVNRMGLAFFWRTREETGAAPADIVRSFCAALTAFDMRSLWAQIERLDNKVPASVQYAMLSQSARLLRHATQWLLNSPYGAQTVGNTVERYAQGIGELQNALGKLVSNPDRKRLSETAALYTQIGVPSKLARRLAKMHPMYSAMDIVEVAHQGSMTPTDVAHIYFNLGEALSLNDLRDQSDRLEASGKWQAMARTSMRESLYRLQRDLTRQVIDTTQDLAPKQAVAHWLEVNASRVQRVHGTLGDMREANANDFASLSVAVQEIRKLADQGANA